MRKDIFYLLKKRFTQQIQSITDITGSPQFTLISTRKWCYRSVSKKFMSGCQGIPGLRGPIISVRESAHSEVSIPTVDALSQMRRIKRVQQFTGQKSQIESHTRLCSKSKIKIVPCSHPAPRSQAAYRICFEPSTFSI